MGSAGSLVSNIIGAKSNKKATKQLIAAGNEAKQISADNFAENKNLLRPFIESGQDAFNAILYERGLLQDAPIIGGQSEFQILDPDGNVVFAGDSEHEARQFLEAERDAYSKRKSAVYTNPQSIRERDFSDEGSNPGRDRANYISAVQGATDAGLAALGPNPFNYNLSEAQTSPGFEYQGFQFSPDHKFLMDEGLSAVTAQAAATGGRNSGATLQALQERGTNLANTFREQYLGALGALSDTGQSAINSQIAAGNLNAGNQANIAIGQGNAQAAGTVQQGQFLGQAVVDGFNTIQEIANFAGGGGGGGLGGLNSIFGGFGGGSAAPTTSPVPVARPSLSF